jgi:hypothetical protein
MKVFVFCSDGIVPKEKSPFSIIFDDVYAQRFIKNLQNDPDLCTGCGKRCNHCRDRLGIDFSSSIAGIHKIPSELLYYVDDPQRFLPEKLPQHDVTVAIDVHEDILINIPELARKAGSKALIVPLEHPNWASKWVRNQTHLICDQLDMECVFPKPFCSLEEGGHPVIDEFIRAFHIGKPKMHFEVENGKIKKATVLRSAPCGATYYVAHNLRGKKIDQKLSEWVAKYWHSYPCVASMQMDYEIGDTILHKGGYLHYEMLNEALDIAGSSSK